MTYNTRNASKQAETSQQSPLRLMQNNFLGFMEGSYEKFEKLLEQIRLSLRGMNGLMNSQDEEEDVMEASEAEAESGNGGGQQQRGVFRIPARAEKLRQKQLSTGYRKAMMALKQMK